LIANLEKCFSRIKLSAWTTGVLLMPDHSRPHQRRFLNLFQKETCFKCLIISGMHLWSLWWMSSWAWKTLRTSKIHQRNRKNTFWRLWKPKSKGYCLSPWLPPSPCCLSRLNNLKTKKLKKKETRCSIIFRVSW